MTSPEVTAVITTCGRPASMQEALASLHAETHPNVELVIVDDGGAIAVPADVPVRIVRGVRLGVGRARNLGLAAARGEFVIFLDDDDVALPNRIGALLSAARRQHADLCFGMTRRVIAETAEILASVPTHAAPGSVSFCDLLMCAPHVNAVLVRAEMLRAAGGFDAEAQHFDDWSAWLRMADRGCVIRSVAETVAEWRIHANGLSGQILESALMKRRLLALFDRIGPRLSEENGRAVAAAREIVARAEIVTYDDYADVMAAARERLTDVPACLA